MKMAYPKLMVALFLTTVPWVMTSSANILVNGNFEDPGIALTTDYVAYSTDNDTAIPGWYLRPTTSDGPNFAIYYTQSTPGDRTTASWIPNAQNGAFLMQLDSTQSTGFTVGCSLYQVISLVSGTEYELSFWINTEVGAGKGGTSASLLNVGTLTGAANIGAIGTSYISNQTFTVTNPANVTPAAAVWQQHSIRFTATTGGDTVIRFADSPTSSNSNVSLDNVSLVVVPEPSVVMGAMLLLGLVGWRERKRIRVLFRREESNA